MLAPLAGAGQEIWNINLPGMGYTPTQGYNWDLNELTKLLELLGNRVVEAGKIPILLGHSFGTTVVSHALSRNKNLAEHLILLSPVTQAPLKSCSMLTRLVSLGNFGYAKILTKLPTALAVAIAQRPGRGQISNRILAHNWLQGGAKVVACSQESHALNIDPQAVSESMIASLHQDCLEASTQIRAKTVIIAGTKDPIAPLKELKTLKNRLNARLYLVENGGHLMHHEHREEVSKALNLALKWLIENPRD